MRRWAAGGKAIRRRRRRSIPNGVSPGSASAMTSISWRQRRQPGRRGAPPGSLRADAALVSRRKWRAFVQLALDDRIALADRKLAAGHNLQRIIAIGCGKCWIQREAAPGGVRRIIAFRPPWRNSSATPRPPSPRWSVRKRPVSPAARGWPSCHGRCRRNSMLVIRRPISVPRRLGSQRLAERRCRRRAFMPSLKLTTGGFGTAVSLLDRSNSAMSGACCWHQYSGAAGCVASWKPQCD